MTTRTRTPKQSPATTTKRNTTSASTAPVRCPTSPDLAHSIGIDCAQEWIDRAPGDTSPLASATAWRARCFADAVHEYEDHPDFLQLLAVWEQGFDATLSAATAGQQPAPKATHKPFSWLADDLKHDQRAQFAATTMDICQGVETCLELVHTSSLERDSGPTLNPNDTDRLLRMAMASIRLLGESAEADIEFLNECAGRDAPEGAA